MADEDRYTAGERVRRQVLGDADVDETSQRVTPRTAPFQEYVTGSAWHDVRARLGLDSARRSLVTIALLAALGHERELALHLAAARRALAATSVQPARAASNLQLTRGAVMSDRLAAALSPHIGGARAAALVAELAEAAQTGRGTLGALASDDQRVTRHLAADEVAAACDPTEALPVINETIDRVLAEHARVSEHS